jgi:hypothetical protein
MKEAVNMKEKNPWLAPSCASLKPWLYQIGMTEFSGEQEELNIAVLAGCLAGELYSSVFSRPAAARKIAWELKKLLGQKKTEKAALYLLLQYRMAGLDIPDLLLWVMANREVSRPFLGHFLNQYRELVKGGAGQ